MHASVQKFKLLQISHWFIEEKGNYNSISMCGNSRSNIKYKREVPESKWKSVTSCM